MNFKKKLAALATTAACAISCIGIGGVNLADDTVIAAGLSGKNAFQITQEMKVGWNLGNTLDANDPSKTDPKASVTCWGNPEPTQATFDTLKTGGFKTVRIPTTWYTHISQQGGKWVVDPQWMAYVKNTVDMALKDDMFVILNIHHENFINVERFTDQTRADAEAKMKGIWSAVAETFKDYDQHLIFEGMNEPRQTYSPSVEWGSGDTQSRAYVNYLNNVFVQTVRGQGSSANKERLLMLPDYVASSDPEAVSSIEIPNGAGNVALSVHAYLPYFFTMATDSHANHEYKADGSSKDGYGNNYKQNIISFFNSMKQISQQKNAPVIIGEFGSSDFGNTQDRVNWTHDYMTYAKDAGCVCVLWDNNAPFTGVGNGENHAYLNRKSNTWYDSAIPVVQEMMKVVGSSGSYEEYVHQDFSWNNIKIGSDWIEIFKSEKGVNPKNEPEDSPGWAPMEVKDAKKYINNGYKIAIVADSAGADPALVVMTDLCGKVDGKGWYYVTPDGTSSQDYVFFYDYNDMVTAAKGTGDDSISALSSVFASEHGAEAVIYGVYAIPTGQTPVVEPTTQPTTQPTPVSSFSWSKVQIPSDWVQLFRSENGETPDGDYGKEWANIEVKGAENYIGEGYKIAMVAESEKTPEIVLMGENWNRISGSAGSQNYVYMYDFADMKKAVEGSGDTIAKAKEHLFASANGAAVTVYGVYAVPTGSTQPTTQPVVTTTTTKVQPVQITTTTTTAIIPSSQDGVYEVKVNKAIDYSKLPEDDKMIGFSWKDFGVKSGEYATKIEFNLSSSKNLGTWVGAFGSSTTVAPDYWTMSDEINKPLSGNNATVTWEPSADIAKTFAYSAGELKFGVWWIDCGQFNIDSIKVYTASGSSNPSAVTTIKATTQAITTVVTTTTRTTTQPVTQPVTQPITQPVTQPIGTPTLLGDVDMDGTVGLSDITALCKHILNENLYKFKSEAAKANADVNRDKVINSMDVSRLIEFNLGKVKSF